MRANLRYAIEEEFVDFVEHFITLLIFHRQWLQMYSQFRNHTNTLTSFLTDLKHIIAIEQLSTDFSMNRTP